ncbi:Tn3 transposase DDE domain protein [Pseudogemmobacter humi]|uniref:Tn3 transposase DDE domain protein n=1 Tax=Pseudogemmobacter humi TaxID=2483812 RepID=A0A3P5XPN1_9RHOB|nr:Tn3 transposase DDE domain protein [Pseudogemmobacter humi]
MGRIERTLLTLDWINDEELRKTTTAELNKGESRDNLVRAVNLHRHPPLEHDLYRPRR